MLPQGEGVKRDAELADKIRKLVSLALQAKYMWFPRRKTCITRRCSASLSWRQFCIVLLAFSALYYASYFVHKRSTWQCTYGYVTISQRKIVLCLI